MDIQRHSFATPARAAVCPQMDVRLVGKYPQRPVLLLRLSDQTSELKYEFRTLFGIGLAEQNAGAPLKGIACLKEQLAQSAHSGQSDRRFRFKVTADSGSK